jgi:hypothetical protein
MMLTSSWNKKCGEKQNKTITYLWAARTLNKTQSVLAEERNSKPSFLSEGEEWSTLKDPNYLGKDSWVMEIMQIFLRD